MADKVFFKADKDESRNLDFEETEKILREMQIEVSNKILKKIFEKYDKNKNKKIELEEFRNIVKDLM